MSKIVSRIYTRKKYRHPTESKKEQYPATLKNDEVRTGSFRQTQATILQSVLFQHNIFDRSTPICVHVGGLTLFAESVDRLTA